MITNLDHWTSALVTKSTAVPGTNGKQEAYGINKLRELIMKLALRGKIVPQDPTDEPSNVHLERMAKDNAKLNTEGEVTAQIRLHEIADEDKPYLLPANWCWARLPATAAYKIGKTPSTKNPAFWSERELGIPWVSIADMGHLGVLTETSKRITPEAAEQVFGYEPVPKGSLLMSFKLTVGKTSILGVDAYHNEAIISLQPNPGIARDYLFKALPIRAQEGSSKRAIMGDTLNSTSLALLLIPVPPLAEQHRIVAKVDQLMGLCDRLEQQQAGSIKAHQTLVASLLETLTRAASTQELTEAWTRIASHTETLLTTENSIEQLKQTIVQLAVMGKLVRQSPDDEPASVLLERIALEKVRLVSQGKIRETQALLPVTDAEKPFDVPDSWVWTRFDNLALQSEAGWSPSCEATPRRSDNWGVLKVSAVTWGRYNPDENKALPSDVVPRPEFEVMPGDFLISRANTAELVARAVVVPQDAPPHLMMSDKIIRFAIAPELDRNYLVLANSSNFSREYYARVAGGTSSSMKNVSREQIRNLAIAIPPLAEQRRIVVKVRELMILCDALKARIAAAQATQVQLADAVLHQAVT